MKKRALAVAGSAALVAAMAAPAIAGETPTDRCNYVDTNNNDETGNFIEVSVNALAGHNIGPVKIPPGAKKAVICHYHGHDAANGRQDEVVYFLSVVPV